MYPQLTYNNSAFCPEYIYEFHMILRINSAYFPEQHQPSDLCNEDTVFPLREELNS
jgi:hypothetical protein